MLVRGYVELPLFTGERMMSTMKWAGTWGVGVLCVVMLVGCGPTLEERRQRARTQYELGVAELNQGNLAEAQNAFEQAKKYDSEDPRLYNGMGLIYLQQQEYQKAIAEFQKALRINPNFVEAHNNLGSTYAQMRDWDRAIIEFREATNDPLYRTPELAHYNLGLALLEKGELIEAVKAFHMAVKLRPNFSRALDKYGVALFRLNRVQEAIKQFKEAIKVEPNYIDPYLNLGLAYMKQGKKEEAIAQFRLVLERSRDEDLSTSARRYLEILE
ncbi:tetratricopeptide repeat protein [candidate division KSB3 bacterium]|uniref:Tetratricopeptide repeat protein n=1 Tax=candidate division KSB3 bacterium TaxID=2044937 RepID=A0A9D5JU54_9BACT|nr:tetratricopeptide repeat protein [candidate division KSB3 bacterium]MBD3324154.1 tetratricopeptide repeat protein [candidate division KSB3 bacterium]